MNGDPTSALAMCTVPYGPEKQVRSLLASIYFTYSPLSCRRKYLKVSVTVFNILNLSISGGRHAGANPGGGT